MPGDVDNDGQINVADLDYLVEYVENGGPAPPVQANGDVDGDCCIYEDDIYYLADYFFHGGPPPVECTCIEPPLCTTCCIAPIRGDINYSGGGIDISDLVYLVSYMFSAGPEPPCMDEADVDASGGVIDIGDMVYLVAYMFRGGPPPVDCPQ